MLNLIAWRYRKHYEELRKIITVKFEVDDKEYVVDILDPVYFYDHDRKLENLVGYLKRQRSFNYASVCENNLNVPFQVLTPGYRQLLYNNE